MKKLAKYLLSFLMVALLLPASTGVPLFAHICTGSGHKDVSIVPISSCCEEEQAASEDHCVEQTPCCSNEATYIYTEAAAVKNPVSEALKVTLQPLLIYLTVTSLPDMAVTAKEYSNQNPEAPPSLSADILSLSTLLRI